MNELYLEFKHCRESKMYGIQDIRCKTGGLCWPLVLAYVIEIYGPHSGHIYSDLGCLCLGKFPLKV